jgi:hypothetical protein
LSIAIAQERQSDGQVRKKLGILNRKIAEFGAMNLEGDIEPSKVEAFAQRKSDLQETITQLQKPQWSGSIQWIVFERSATAVEWAGRYGNL